MTSDTMWTGRFALPLIASGQAGKDVTHNEALTLIDMLLLPVAEGVRAEPPEAPSPGSCWIVEAGGTGAWSGRDGALACWTAGGWRFADMPAGGAVRLADGRGAWRAGDEWRTAMPVPAPAGGSHVDAEARETLGKLLELLRFAGIVAA